MIVAGRSTDELETLLALFAGGGALIFNGVSRILRTRRVQDTARIRIANAAQGTVAIEGFAWCLKEPMRNSDGQYCAYYTCKLEEEVGSGKNRYWETRWSYVHEAAFASVDQTGSVIVLHKDSETDCDTRITDWSELLKTKNGRAIAKLIREDRGKDISTELLGGTFRLSENFITLGSPCYVQGRLDSVNIDRAQIVNSHISAFYEYIKKRPPGEVHKNLRFDMNRDGTVTHHEVSNSMHVVAQKIVQLDLKSFSTLASMAPIGSVPVTNSEPPKVYGCVQNDSDHKLIIAGMHEHHLVKRVSSSNLLRVVAGALLIAGGVVYLARHLFNVT